MTSSYPSRRETKSPLSLTGKREKESEDMDAMRDKNIDLEATELRLGLPGTSEKQIVARSNKRALDESTEGSSLNGRDNNIDRLGCSIPPPSK